MRWTAVACGEVLLELGIPPERLGVGLVGDARRVTFCVELGPRSTDETVLFAFSSGAPNGGRDPAPDSGAFGAALVPWVRRYRRAMAKDGPRAWRTREAAWTLAAGSGLLHTYVCSSLPEVYPVPFVARWRLHLALWSTVGGWGRHRRGIPWA